MKKFKVGDRVTLHDEGYMLNEKQQAGTIVNIVEETEDLFPGYDVKVDNYEPTTLFFYEEELKHEEAAQ